MQRRRVKVGRHGNRVPSRCVRKFRVVLAVTGRAVEIVMQSRLIGGGVGGMAICHVGPRRVAIGIAIILIGWNRAGP